MEDFADRVFSLKCACSWQGCPRIAEAWEYVLPTALACAGYAVGRQDEAIQHVKRALAIGDASRSFLTSYWPYCARLHKNSEIDRLLKEHGIP